MPALKAFCTSSENALAVIARIGIFFASGWLLFRNFVTKRTDARIRSRITARILSSSTAVSSNIFVPLLSTTYVVLWLLNALLLKYGAISSIERIRIKCVMILPSTTSWLCSFLANTIWFSLVIQSNVRKLLISASCRSLDLYHTPCRPSSE